MLLSPHLLRPFVFCGFLLGGFGLAVLSGCGDPAPVTAEKSKFQVAGEGDTEPGKEDSKSAAKSDSAFPGLEADPVVGEKTPGTGEEPANNDVAKTPGAVEDGADDTKDYGASPQYPLPKGKDPQDLAEFLRNLDEKKPKGRTKQEQEADFLAIQDSRLAAARKLLTFPIPPQAKMGLLQLTLEIHQALIAQKIPGAEDRLAAYAKELRGSKDPQMAEIGRVQEFDIAVNKLATQDPPPADGKEVAAEIQKFVDAAKDSPVSFMVGARKCMELQRQEGATEAFKQDMLEQLKKVAASFTDNSEPQVAAQAKKLLVDVELKPVLENVGTGKEGAEEELLAAAKKQLDGKKASPELIASLQEAAEELEYSLGKYQTALKIYDLLEPSLKDDERAVESLESARKRLSLVGKPLVVEGVTPDGKPFDFAAYKGKVVLVDFWATWCGPCLQELPNVKRNYEAYHAKGFDVIGVSIDSELETLAEFLKLQGPPWTTVISEELFQKKTLEDGFGSHPTAVACGVKAIPFVVLLGADGNVDSIHVRGPKLAARLKELLGEPAEKGADEKPAEEKPADEKPAPEKPGEKPGEEKPATEKAAEEKSAKESPAEEPQKEEGGGSCGAEVEEEKKEASEEEVNPYSARPELSTEKLVAYIEKMLDKPKSIQSRPGFAEAVVEACDRVLAASPAAKEAEALTAAEAKFETLHKKACAGDEACDKALAAFTAKMKEDPRPRIARPVAFFQMERKVLDGAALPADKVPDLLKELKDYYAAEKLTSKHLRMASSTVGLINKLESGDEREKQFAEFGGLFAKASDKELARYGKKLAQKPEAEESDLVGKELELAGPTAAGNDFKWADYRGKVVLVDFWATWCGPCRKEMPHVKELYEKLQPQGFAVVGVSLDKDQEALAAYLAENQIPWENLAGDETQDLAAKYGVRGIPTMMAIGKDGKILGVSHNVGSLVPIIEKALSGK